MSRCIPKNSALVHRHSRRGLASGQSSWGQSFMHYSSQDYGADGVVVSLTTRGTFTHWKEGTLAVASKIFIELTGMTRARAATASWCSACELAVRCGWSRETAVPVAVLPLPRPLRCVAWTWAATRRGGLSFHWHSALRRIWTGSDGFGQLAANGGGGHGHSRPLETSRRAQGEGSVARRRSAGCQSVGSGRPG